MGRRKRYDSLAFEAISQELRSLLFDAISDSSISSIKEGVLGTRVCDSFVHDKKAKKITIGLTPHCGVRVSICVQKIEEVA